MIASMNRVRVFYKGQALYFNLERKFNLFKRTVLFQFTPIGKLPVENCNGNLRLVYDNVEHIFKPQCEELKLNYDLRYSLEKYLKECEVA
jgi:hypothetical protein